MDNPIIKRGNKQNIIKNSGDIFISRSVEKNINNDVNDSNDEKPIEFSFQNEGTNLQYQPL